MSAPFTHESFLSKIYIKSLTIFIAEQQLMRLSVWEAADFSVVYLKTLVDRQLSSTAVKEILFTVCRNMSKREMSCVPPFIPLLEHIERDRNI